MNVAESMKHVLKSKSQNIFTDFWKDDLKTILKDFKNDFSRMANTGESKFKTLRSQSLKETLSDIKESAVDTVMIFRVIPKRMKEGFSFFKEELLEAMDELEDPKQKTVFSLKVMGALSGFTLNALYGVNKKKSDFKFSGLRLKNAFTQFIVMELVFKITKLFMLRFLSEVEKELSEEDDKKNINYFKSLMTDDSKLESLNAEPLEAGDRAFQIVENLRNYILTGQKSG